MGPREVEDRLLPCPFCGGKAYVSCNGSFTYSIICYECGVRTQNFDHLEDVEAIWNRRV